MSAELIAAVLARTPGWAEQAEAAGLDDVALSQILEAAEVRAQDDLAPLAARADAAGCSVEGGRVIVPEGYTAAYRALAEDGWIGTDLSSDLGGMGLPLPVHVAATLPMEGAALPFMMAVGSSRAGAHLLAGAAPELAAEWAPRIASGEWMATICISEPDAGSDVGRIRTRARREGDRWVIEGTKCWISFGDHDMADRIGHLLLARTGTPEEGSRGLSLFLVADRDETGARNGIILERIEEKLGLHGSPTCVLRFDGAEATLVGAPGRGLSQLFGMIELMRLQVGTQGAGIALECARLARHYAAERRQGGDPSGPPTPIEAHPDVQRQLAVLDAHAVLLTALVLEAAVTMEQAHRGDDGAMARAAFLLPLVKTFGGELGTASASGAIQIFAGAGYTREWPVERHYRDARIMTIYEGTTGMQAQDFLLRRLIKEEGRGLEDFAARVATELTEDSLTEEMMERLRVVAARLRDASPEARLRAAEGALRAGWCAVSAVLAARMTGHDARTDRAMAQWRALLPARMAEAEAQVAFGVDLAGVKQS